eukprot:6179966-Pleurochrysis_carterae.AAC.2
MEVAQLLMRWCSSDGARSQWSMRTSISRASPCPRASAGGAAGARSAATRSCPPWSPSRRRQTRR